MIDRNKILKALLKYPQASDGKIAMILRISQPTVSRVRKIFEAKQCIRFIAIPDPSKIGYEIIAFTLIKVDVPKDEESVYAFQHFYRNIVYAIETLKGVFIMSLHRNYTDYIKFFSSEQIIWNVLIPTSQKPIKDFTFTDLSLIIE